MPSTISDIIESFLLEVLGEEEIVSICRNELASHFSCAPSQINYVLTTRFTVDRGFVVQSKRGGGGYITIHKRAQTPQKSLLIQIMRQIEEGLSFTKASHLTDRLQECQIISPREADLIKAAVSDKALRVEHPQKNKLRASILQQMLSEILK